ncbi:MAG: hypothetical protein ACLTZB_04525 [Streptococcus salivarius]
MQYKGKAVKVSSRYKYYDENDGQPVTNRFAQIEPNVWAYFGADGYAVTGEQVINGQHLYFDQSGRQVRCLTSQSTANAVTTMPTPAIYPRKISSSSPCEWPENTQSRMRENSQEERS